MGDGNRSDERRCAGERFHAPLQTRSIRGLFILSAQQHHTLSIIPHRDAPL